MSGKYLFLLCAVAPGVVAAPAIARNAVYNNASYAQDGALNRGIAQGSVFAIFGSGLGPAGLIQADRFPLAKELGGTSVKVAVRGTTVDAYPLYVSEGQVGAILPSNTALGDGTLTVSFQGQTSAPQPIVVVRRNFGIFALNQAGSGPAILQNFIDEKNLPANTLLTPARPGQTVILWGTGLGPVDAREAEGPAPGDFDARIAV